MIRAHSVAAVRAAERAEMELLTSGVLMARAATGVATVGARRLGSVYSSRVVVLAGSGDNGGDALYAGAWLARRGARVDVLAAGDIHAGGWTALQRAGGRRWLAGGEGDPLLLGAADLVLDGLVGIGGRGALREPAARLARLAPPECTVAVDVPSGVDSDTGAVAGAAVRAAVTVTFGAYKRGLLIAPGAFHTGHVELIDIGISPHLGAPDLTALEAADAARRLPSPGPEDSKYTRGVVGVVAGSPAYTGAAVLSTGSAALAGAGMVRFVSAAHPAEIVRNAHPEVVITVIDPGDSAALLAAGQVQAWVVGPGMGTDEGAARLVAAVLGTDRPVLVDADALTILSRDLGLVRGRRAPTLLTPHAGEFQRLTGVGAQELAADRLGVVRATAADLGVTVLLKGSRTLVVAPDGAARVNLTTSAKLATAGSGDVLSGACGAFLAAGLAPIDAGSLAAYLHGQAACAAPAAMTAPDLLRFWAAAVRDILRSSGSFGEDAAKRPGAGPDAGAP